MSRFELAVRHRKFEARWENALRVMERVNSLLDRGYLILDEKGHPVGRFYQRDTFVRGHKPLRGGTLPAPGDRDVPAICQKLGETSSILWFIKDPDLDNGMYTSIRDFNRQFEGWAAIPPEGWEKIL